MIMKAVEIYPLPVDNVYISVYNSHMGYEYLSRMQKSYQQAFRFEMGKKRILSTEKDEKALRFPPGSWKILDTRLSLGYNLA